MSDEPATLVFSSQEEWERWLEEHHDTPAGVWLKIARKGTDIESVTHAEALESALCFGWIDGQRKSLDEGYFLQKFTPRRKRSRWSQVNRDKATELIEQGRRRPPGLAEVERAREDGRWDAAYASPSRITVPDDLQRELDSSPAAKALFEELDSRNRYAILYQVEEARRPETRARRIEKFVAMLAAGEKPYP